MSALNEPESAEEWAARMRREHGPMPQGVRDAITSLADRYLPAPDDSPATTSRTHASSP